MINLKNLSHFLIILCLFLFSCQNEARWYPHAEVTISNSVEHLDPASGVKSLQITLIIHNTSNTTITTSSLTIQANTNKQEYLQTAGSTARIIPGGKIAVNTTIPYLEANENLVMDGVALYSAFFD
jgi:hypothetical protein